MSQPLSGSRNFSRDALNRLAENRRARIGSDGRPVFDLSREEAEASSRAAMRLAGFDVPSRVHGGQR